jgi:hypothetical protein
MAVQYVREIMIMIIAIITLYCVSPINYFTERFVTNQLQHPNSSFL